MARLQQGNRMPDYKLINFRNQVILAVILLGKYSVITFGSNHAHDFINAPICFCWVTAIFFSIKSLKTPTENCSS